MRLNFIFLAFFHSHFVVLSRNTTRAYNSLFDVDKNSGKSAGDIFRPLSRLAEDLKTFLQQNAKKVEADILKYKVTRIPILGFDLSPNHFDSPIPTVHDSHPELQYIHFFNHGSTGKPISDRAFKNMVFLQVKTEFWSPKAKRAPLSE